MRKLGVACGVVFLVVSSVHAARAPKKVSKTAAVEQPAPEPGAIQAAPDLIRVRVGSGNVITFPSRVLRVAVGDEKLVAVHVIESKQILLQGLAPGRSTFFAWLADGRRLKYDLVVSPRMEVLESALHDLDPRINLEQNGDGSSLVLSGRVDSEKVANAARQLAENMLGTVPGTASRVISLIQFPGSNDADIRLTSALGDVDPRIHLRRMQVGSKVSNTADAVVLEGRVKDISALVRAITLAELQLGGVGGKIEPLSPDAVANGRNHNFSGLSRLQTQDEAPQGLASYIARGLILKSASGRVLSFLEVDELPQIMVNIRVLQIDRGRARRLGIDYRVDGARFSVGSFQQPGRTNITAPPSPPSITSILGGNVVATFVDKTFAIAAAIDFLQQKDLARSVAEPNITTLSGESASVLIGGEVPIPTTTVGTVTSVQGFLFQDFGVRLDIRPTLAPNGLVAMEISPSIIRPSADLSVSGVPGFNVQSVQTTAKVAPGQTLVIGGLISFTDEAQKRGVPGLSEIPLLKHLFSWEGRTLQEQEILFVITPRIINERPDDVAEALQWRDVEPLPPGVSIELPAADADPRTMTPLVLSPNGLPPSFTAAATRPSHGTSNYGDEPPPPPPHQSKSDAPANVPAATTAALDPPDLVREWPTIQPTAPPPHAPIVTTTVAEPAPVKMAQTPAVTIAEANPVIETPRPAEASKPLVEAEVSKPGPAPAVKTVPLADPPKTAPATVRETPAVVNPPKPAAVVEKSKPVPEAATQKPGVVESAKEPAKEPAKSAPSPASKPVILETPKPAAVATPMTTPVPVAETAKPAPVPAAQKPSAVEPSKVVPVAPMPKPVQVAESAKPAPSTTTEPKPVPVTQKPAPVAESQKPAAPTVVPARRVAAQPIPMPVQPATHTTPGSAPAATAAISSASTPRAPSKIAATQQAAVPPSPIGATPMRSNHTVNTTPSAVAVSRPSPAEPVKEGPATIARKPWTEPTDPPMTHASSASSGPVSKSAVANVPYPTPTSKVVVPAENARSVSARPARPGSPIMAIDINPELRASVTRDYKITVVVSPHPGDAWSRLARRLTGDARHWEEIAALNGAGEILTAEQKVRIPFEMLRPELQQQIVITLFPKGSAAEDDWKRAVASEQARR
jgi:Flp pilus assembly secretin CpaC